MDSKAPITVIIATYNEETNIKACIESVKWCQQIIIVDGSSTDKTVAIAEEAEAHVISRKKAPAEELRLEAISSITQPWFMLLDADERVSEELQQSIQSEIKSSHPQAAYYVLRRKLLFRASHAFASS